MEATKEKHTHTPGPWHYTLADETSSGGVYGGEKCVCDIIPKELQVAYDCEELEITHANARLIAAAPEMLIALKNVKQALRMPTSFEAIRLLVVEAIHKAEVDGGEG